MSVMQQHALAYAERGWRVMPIWWVEAGGTCGCGNPFCSAVGKHPLVRTGRGLEGSSAEAGTIQEWWGAWPEANIAVACGRLSGIVVVDLDVHGDQDGEYVFKAWCAGQGIEVPATLVQETGSGGRHYVFRYPALADGDPGIKNANGWLEGVDLKADGGYILVPPSSHASGGRYRWLVDLPPADLGELLGPLRRARGSGGGGGQTAAGDQPDYSYRDAVRGGPPAGARDHFFNARAFELRKCGTDKDTALEDLRRLWEACEQPPGREFPWETVLDKVKRVWDTVEPEEVAAITWDPFAAVGAVDVGVGTVVTVTGDGTIVGPGDPPVEMLTDTGNALRLVRLHGQDIRYSKALDWLMWDGKSWVPDVKDKIVELAGGTARRMFQEAVGLDGAERDQLLAWAKMSENRGRIEAMVALARSKPQVAVVPEELDRNQWILCCENGVVNLITGGLEAHDRSQLVTKRSPVAYDPAATSKIWDGYLSSVTGGDQELEAYLRRAVGYTLTGSTREEVFFIIYGPKGSGKSTFTDAIGTILGPLAMTVQPDILTHIQGKQAPADTIADMLGKRAVVTVEMPEGGRFAEVLVKQMTGRDMIRGRHLYKSAFEFRPQFKLWVATNHSPKVYDDAMWRRIRRVPFPRAVPPGEQDWQIKTAVTDPESETARAVLAWAVRGCLEWIDFGLGQAQIVAEDTAEYEEEQDKFGQFLAEECDPDATDLDETSIVDAYDRYSRWAERSGERPMQRQAFSLKLKERGFKRNMGARPVRYYKLKLRDVNVYGL